MVMSIMMERQCRRISWILKRPITWLKYLEIDSEGIIQVLVEGRQVCNREVGQKLAEISRRPIIYNAITAFDAPPDSSPEVLAIADRWQESIAWSEELEKRGSRGLSASGHGAGLG